MAGFTTGQAGGTIQNVGAVPAAYATDAQELARSQRLAQMLSSQTPAQGQMVSGRYVAPSITQNLAGLVNAGVGAYFSDKAEKQQLELAKKLREGDSAAIADFMKTKQGTPAGEMAVEMAGPYGQSGGGMNVPQPMAMQDVPAVAGNAQEAYANLQADPRISDSLRNMARQKMFADNEAFNLPEGSVRFERQPDGTLKQVAAGGEKTSNDYKDYQIAIKDPISPYKGSFQQYQKEMKQAGANKFDFSNMMGKGVLNTIGPMLVESKTATSGAVQQAVAANQILRAIDTNAIFTGIGAKQKMTMAQIAQLFGISGELTDEKIANTRGAVQGLAQLTLQGRKQMRGEGSITESEGALAQKAMSGEIDLTKEEIRLLANAAKRASKFTYEQHQSMLGALEKDSPNAVPYYQINVNPSIFGPVGGSSSNRDKADAIIGDKE